MKFILSLILAALCGSLFDMNLYDAHNHLQDERFAGRQDDLVAVARAAGVVRMVVNGSCAEDWPQVAELARRFPGFVIPSVGLHPWYVPLRQDDCARAARPLARHPGRGGGRNRTRPLEVVVNFVKEIKTPFIATNIPCRYASLVSKKGFEALDTLSVQEKSWIAPLPMDYDSTLPGYVNMITMMGGHGSANMPKAQASKDATMAYFILQNLKPGTLFIHYNGAYHSDNFDGINWYLKKKKPELAIGTISTVSQKNIKELLDENRGKADFISCVDEDMTTTYKS